MSENKGCSNQSCTKESCESCEHKQESLLTPANPYSSVKKVIGVVSGKGGVGKSLVTSLLSVMMNKRGHHTGILDADITGPSIPKAFGITGDVMQNEQGFLPVKSSVGIDVMSINLLLEDETQPVLWRGPMIAGTVKQFWQDVVWDDVDYLFVDMPPGTGDVALTVFQSLPIDGIVIVTSPQELVSMIVAKAVNMANKMNVPILGLVENMSYFMCPSCKEKHTIFGESHIEQIAKEFKINSIARLPIDPSIAAACDAGKIETIDGTEWLSQTADLLEEMLKK